jgi:transposase
MNEWTFYEKLLGLPDLKITAVEESATKLILCGQYLKTTALCPVCLQPTGTVNQVEVRKFRDLSISGREVWLHLSLPQFYCVPCQRYFFDHPAWVMPGKSYTRRQAKWIFEMCEKQAFTQVAALTNMCIKTVERLFYATAEHVVNLPQRYAQVRHLGIDEVAYRKGKGHYACVLTDLERGIQLDVLPNRRKETLIAHFQQLGSAFCEQIQVVACDMWGPYQQVAHACFPQAQTVIDRFHVVKLLNQVLDTERKRIRQAAPAATPFKQLKWLLFKQNAKCSDAEKAQLEQAFGQAPDLANLYKARESFNQLFEEADNKGALNTGLDTWVTQAKVLGNKGLTKFTKTVARWQDAIAAFADGRVTNAVTEGLNNYLRYMQRISFGLSNFNNLRMRILVASA